MRYSEIYTQINEGANTRCIVVDVQPQYTSKVNWVPNMLEWLNRQGSVLAFVNAETTGLTLDTVDDIKDYWEENGYDPNRWQDTTIVDKGYGYLRGWMDGGAEPRAIIRTIREMYAQHVSDSRELYGGEDDPQYNTNMQKLLGADWEEWMRDDAISVEWTSVAQLKRWSGAYITGGARNECLREVQLLMNAFNIRYRVIDRWVYG